MNKKEKHESYTGWLFAARFSYDDSYLFFFFRPLSTSVADAAETFTFFFGGNEKHVQ